MQLANGFLVLGSASSMNTKGTGMIRILVLQLATPMLNTRLLIPTLLRRSMMEGKSYLPMMSNFRCVHSSTSDIIFFINSYLLLGKEYPFRLYSVHL